MAKKISVLTLLIFFVFGAVTAMAVDNAAPKKNSITQSMYNWFGAAGKSNKTVKPAKTEKKPEYKPVPGKKNMTQAMYNWCGMLDKWGVSKSERFCKACGNPYGKTCCKDCNIDCGGTCCSNCGKEE